MARTLMHVGIGLILLTFMVGMVSLFIAEADRVTSVDSGIVTDSFNSYTGDLDDTLKDLNLELSSKINNNSDLTIEQDQLLEDRTTEGFGIINLFSKNILVSFFSNVATKLKIEGVILSLILTMIAFIIMMLVVRGIWGNSKV